MDPHFKCPLNKRPYKLPKLPGTERFQISIFYGTLLPMPQGHSIKIYQEAKRTATSYANCRVT